MLELVFFTSSRIKLSHAEYLCKDHAVKVTGFREKTFGANYDEPRIYNREQLIKESYQDALQRWNKATNGNGYFIIEDTSVIIEALSEKAETPGLDIKYWMQDMDFATLDSQLKKNGNNRNVTVRSDLILHLPEVQAKQAGKSFLQFTSFVKGTVVEEEQSFETNAVYPWLDNKTFNKWFAPQGHILPISLLPIAEADKGDFRSEAFKLMLEYLEANEPRLLNSDIPHLTEQTSFNFDTKILVVFGPSCAGKTTLAEHLRDKFGYRHIEASDYMYLSYYRRHGVGANLSIGSYAEQALQEKPEIVAEQIVRDVEGFEKLPTVITGFRALEELDWFIQNYDKEKLEFVYVDAEFESRYERSVLRSRDGEAKTKADFLLRDKQQFEMGLEKLKDKYQSKTISNNNTKDSYFLDFETKFNESIIKNTFNEKPTVGKLEKQILLVLAKQWESKAYFTTAEIAALINAELLEKPKSKNNISRYFNQSFHAYYEIDFTEDKRKYRLSNTGYSLAKLLKKT